MDGYAPITYHPLDLSYPELDRVLGEMDEAFGDQLKGKVECIGLHGDYEAGLQLIRQGKLGALRRLSSTASSLPEMENAGMSDSSLSPASSTCVITPELALKPLEHNEEAVVDISPLPSAITQITTSDGSGTWSPINSDQAACHPPAPQNQETSPESPDRPLHIVFLGSSLGNFDRKSAAPFLKSLPLRKGDTLLLGLDGRPEAGKEGSRKVEVAYNDPAGHTRAFEEHGWDVVRQELGLKGDAGVEFVGRYNESLGRSSSLSSASSASCPASCWSKDVSVTKEIGTCYSRYHAKINS